MSKIYWIHIDMNDYRSGTNIYAYPKAPRETDVDEDESEDDEYAPEEAVPYNFKIPSDYCIYIVTDYPEYKIKACINTEKRDILKKLYHKMFSQLHDCLPFEVTGHNCAYKEEGYYPEVPYDIKKMPDIKIIEEMKEENDSGDHVYFVFAIDNEGNEVFSEML